jgi:hypothetical protein
MKVYISGQKRGVTDPIKCDLRRRSAVEPVIGHAKAEHRMGLNFLDDASAVTTSAGSSPGSQPFGASSSWRRSPTHPSPPSPRPETPEPNSHAVLAQAAYFTVD